MSQWGGNGTRREFIARGAATVVAGFMPGAVTNLMAQRTGNAMPTSQKRDAGRASSIVPQPLQFGEITAGGDLAHRSAQNFTRLQSPIYRPPRLFSGQTITPGRGTLRDAPCWPLRCYRAPRERNPATSLPWWPSIKTT